MSLLERLRPVDRGVADVTGPLLQRRRRHRRRWIVRILVTTVVLGLIATGVWLWGFSSVFAAQRVQVSGTDLVSRRAVTEVAAVPLGRPLVTIDTTVIERRVETLTPVRSVSVQRRWPHTVSITVVERTPVLRISRNGADVLVDADGVPYATVDDAPKNLAVADVGVNDAATLRNVATVAAALPPAIRGEVDRIEASSAESIRLRLNGGATVVWGNADASAVKAEVLTALLPQKASVYDVSGPANPTTRG